MSSRTGFLASVLLLGSAVVAGILLPGWTYLPVNLGLAAALVWISVRSGAAADALGLDPARLRRAVGPGLAVAAAVVLAIGIAAAVPATRGLFEDRRAGGAGVAGLLYQVLLRIPLGTALFEEVAFRGVLVGLGREAWGRRAGTWASSALFGLWHLAPAWVVADANAAAAGTHRALVLAAAVAATTVAGRAFVEIRDRAGHLAAPVIVHAAANSAAFTAAWTLF